MLREIISREKHSKSYDDVKWDTIAKKMQKQEFNKSAKQCRERWIQQLNPTLSKEKWTYAENLSLLRIYTEKGNHWKDISKFFSGRTDNATKNQFFSLIRKGLRKACKQIGRTSNTQTINSMKPRVLSEFFNMNIKVPPDRENVEGQSKEIQVGEFIEKMAFSKKSENAIMSEDVGEIAYIIGILHSMKSTYKRIICRSEKN
jgi:hypothetical protein